MATLIHPVLHLHRVSPVSFTSLSRSLDSNFSPSHWCSVLVSHARCRLRKDPFQGTETQCFSAKTNRRSGVRSGMDEEGTSGSRALAPVHLTGLQALADSGQYEAWLLDQFGVLHDGKQAYPGAVEALERLAASGVRLVLISNSSKRAKVTIDKLPGLGFDPHLFAGVVTSGELTHHYLLRRNDPWFAAIGRKCLHFTWSSRGAVSLEGLDLEVVEDPEEADFILAHGTEALGLAGEGVRAAPLDELEGLLERATHLPRKIPMIVANPDMVTVEARALRVMPGTLGLKYEELGGEVRWMGKPDPIIYEAAMEMAGVHRSKAIAVGDSLHHDVGGASRGGIASVFVAGGIHADELSIQEPGSEPNLATLQALLADQKAQPNYVISSFRW